MFLMIPEEHSQSCSLGFSLKVTLQQTRKNIRKMLRMLKIPVKSRLDVRQCHLCAQTEHLSYSCCKRCSSNANIILCKGNFKEIYNAFMCPERSDSSYARYCLGCNTRSLRICLFFIKKSISVNKQHNSLNWDVLSLCLRWLQIQIEFPGIVLLS